MFEKATNSTLYQNVVAQICTMIRDGDIEIGSLLPSESKLCEQFQVSRTTVREALSILAKRKIIQTIRGKGSIVIADNYSYLDENLRGRIDQYENTFEYATEARQLLEPQIAAHVARNATKQDIEDLQAIIDSSSKKEADGTLTTKDLRTFHIRVAEATHNPVLVSLVDSLIGMCDAPPETSLQVPNPARQKWTSIVAGHDCILQAIREHDPEDAYFMMKANLRNFHDNSLSEY